ncbi:flagellar basal-body MS-ring/collar protein FliF [Nocardioides sp. AE5]|uniref:flagellar basal-body MS-ring/collar protein FliF n=1 Tax=Nocardioides sp. AE5 TaxID=2962573 RepID=UPI002880EFD2|nr:flagellar basal-body MS-ring/collar protein FliF [Nocardioides sp. AE5]MDT0200803.1 flagellar basal-body MS-ring/collar protein FliF [Nocardioides sp. AE5]
MKQNITAALGRYRDTFSAFSTAQKAIVLIGAGALLLAGFMVFRWAATPSYAPLYANMASADAAAVIDELDAQGVKYTITNNGSTIMVPKDDVYATRIALSGKGLPSSSSNGGYELLDGQSFTTGEFKQQTDFKRAMEGELAKTIEAMDSINTAVVHLALPAQRVFADEQDPATASVLVKTSPGTSLAPQNVQAIVHLVASSIEGLDPARVTVADASGQVLTTDDSVTGAASTRNQQVQEFETRMRNQVQATLDRLVGPGNSTVQVTANLNFDNTRTETRTYTSDPDQAPLSETTQSETYTGTGNDTGATGVVGPDGQMENLTEGEGNNSSYSKESTTRDNAVNSTTEFRETAPGGVQSMHVGVMIDNRAAMALDTNEINQWVVAATGIDAERGDTVRVSAMPFDRSAEEAMQAELDAAAAADAADRRNDLIRDVALVGAVLLLVAFAFWRERRRSKERARATSYVVEQLRNETALAAPEPAPEMEPATALLALEANEASENERLQHELIDLVERQPEDVAALLRGWLVDRP